MQQQHGRAVLRAETAPVATMTLPEPAAMLSQWALWRAGVHSSDEFSAHYCEGRARLSLGDGFSGCNRVRRGTSLLLARSLARRPSGNDGQRWLDLMSGCGIRALRWGLEALPEDGSGLELWVNDADPDRLPLLESNLAVLQSRVAALRLSAMPAEVLLARAFVEKRFFDLIDLDAFGSPSALIQLVLQVLAFDGVLLLASTDGRSPTGHDRRGAIRHFGAAARVHQPAGRWRCGCSWVCWPGRPGVWVGLQPLLAFSEGRTFRLAVRLTRRPIAAEEEHLGLVARCERCGDQQLQSMLRLQGWPHCHCQDGGGRWAISGPLWLGPLQDSQALADLMDPSTELQTSTQNLIKRLQADPGMPARIWPTDELSRRLGMAGPPRVADLVEALRSAGHQAWPSSVMAGQVRTDADLPELLQLCVGLRSEGL